MRLSADGWYSGEHFWVTRDVVEREFSFDAPGSALGGIQHMSSCACAGCLSKIFEHVAVDQSITPPVQQVVEPPDIPDNTSTPYVLAIGGSDTGNIATVGDDDWFAVTLTAGQSYVFTMTPSGASPLEDTYLEIYNSAGALIGLDDDGGPGTNSLLRWTATESGTYYINARAWEPESPIPNYTGTGTYTVSAAIGPPQNPLDTINLGYTAPLNIQVWFSTAGQSHTFGNTTVTAFRAWTPEEITQAMAALQTFSNITNLVFSIAPTLGEAEFVITIADLEPGTLGFFGSTGGVGYGAFAYDGTGWTTGASGGLNQGGLGFVTLIHEFGHGLGLAHPHDNSGVSEVMQGVTGLFNSYGTFGLNQGVYTTMTYNDGWELQFGNGVSTYGSQGTPMALDVALLQQRYGANGTFNQGANTYVLPTVNQPGTFFACIWDTGGIDTIVHNGSTGATIDLRAATLLNAIGGGGWVSWVSGIRGGFTIANGVVIENATGGSGSDILIGNAANNVLDGGAGSDSMQGGLGNDTYVVETVGDTVIEAANEGTDLVLASVSYTLLNNVENLTFTGSTNLNAGGNSSANAMTGNSGGNYIDAGGGNDVLLGLGGNDTLVGGLGADAMAGGLGDDVHYVDSNSDTVTELSGEGYDWIFASVSVNLPNHIEGQVLLESAGQINAGGNGADNFMQGNSFDNGLDGGAGTDTLYGLGGNDTLFGGGLDNLFGGTGNDVYIVDNPGTNITELAGEGYDWVFTTTSYNLPGHVDGMVLDASAGQINAGGNSADNYIQGNGADNGLDGGAGTDTLVGGGGNDTLFGGGLDNLIGGIGNDIYIVDNPGTNVTELAGEGYDWIFTTSSFTMQAHVDGMVLEAAGGAINAGGNAQNNYIQGNTSNNGIDGGAGADTLVGFGGDDTFVFQAGQANGDVINDFIGNGAGAGDRLVFQGYGTAAQGATFTQLNATQWQITSANGLITDILTLANGAAIDPSDYFFGP